MTSTYLAFDIGTTGTKAALIDAGGRVLRAVTFDYPTHTAAGGIVEQDARDWLHAVRETLRQIDAGDVNGVILTGQMQNVTLTDAAGEPLRRTILYSDTRAHAETQQVNAALTPDTLRTLTGNDQDAGSLLAKLVWLQNHEPDTLKQAAHLFIGAADFVAYHLTGVALSDTTTAATTGLMDIEARAVLPQAVFDTLGIPMARGLIAPLAGGGALVGTLREGFAVKPGTPVYLGPGDAGAATLGAGSGVAGKVYAYIGTSGWVAFTSQGRTSRESRVFTLAHPDAARTMIFAPLLTAGGNLAWARDVFGEVDFGAMIAAALARDPSAMLYLPYLNGERSPFDDPFARGAFIGLSASHTRADMVRAVLEGVVFGYRHALEALAGSEVSALTLTGGGTRSAAWCQLFTDVLGIPVSVAQDAENVGLRGALIAARTAAGELDTYAPEGFFPVAAHYMPDSTHKAHYDRQFARFKQAYPALRDLFHSGV